MRHLTGTDLEGDTALTVLRDDQFSQMQGHPCDPRREHLIDTIANQAGEASDVTGTDDLCAGLNGNADALAVHALTVHALTVNA